MAIPKNKNIRKITVDNIQYYWSIKFDEDYGLINCSVGLVEEPSFRFKFNRGANSKHIRWIQNGVEKKDEIQAITPNLIEEAITFANNNIDWKNRKLTLIASNSDGFSLIDWDEVEERSKKARKTEPNSFFKKQLSNK